MECSINVDNGEHIWGKRMKKINYKKKANHIIYNDSVDAWLGVNANQMYYIQKLFKDAGYEGAICQNFILVKKMALYPQFNKYAITDRSPIELDWKTIDKLHPTNPLSLTKSRRKIRK